MNISDIAMAFSQEEFERNFPLIAGQAVWTVAEKDVFYGKSVIVANCMQVGAYFASVTTKYQVLQVIAEDNKVAVSSN